MKFETHLDNTTKRLRFLLYVLSKLRSTLNSQQILKIYYGLFHSAATYGIIAWGGTVQAKIDNLIKLQKSVLKVIFSKNTNLNSIKVPPSIRQTFFTESLMSQYQILNFLYETSFSYTRNKNIQLPKNVLNVGKRSFGYVAIKIYNLLPSEYKLLKIKHKTIKYHIKAWVKKYFNTDEKIKHFLL